MLDLSQFQKFHLDQMSFAIGWFYDMLFFVTDKEKQQQQQQQQNNYLIK